MNDPTVAIVILNWNGWADTIECLESVYQNNYTNYEVVLVDNNSTDDSIQKIKDYSEGKLSVVSKFFNYVIENKPIQLSQYSSEELESIGNSFNNKQLTIIKNDINEGFAEGNNIGIKFALKKFNPEYILLLNNDTVVNKDFLTVLVDEGQKNENAGLLGPKMYYYDDPTTIWCIGGKIDWKFARGVHVGINKIDKGQYDEKKSFDYINGSALLIKREVIQEIGFLDKRLFLYFEETDFALKAAEKGFKSIYIPKSKIWHKVSKSSGGMSKSIGLYYITRNRWLFMKIWAKKSDYTFFIIYQLIGALIFPLLLSIYYRNSLLFKAYYYGLKNGIFSEKYFSK